MAIAQSAPTRRMGVRDIAVAAALSALLCVAAPLSIPLAGLVPLSLATLAILLGAYILGPFQGLLFVALYIAVGAAGMPVFSGFEAGLAKLIGPTGGYIAGYLFLVLIAGFFVGRFQEKTISHRVICLAGMLAGTMLLYGFGTVWFMHVQKTSLTVALGLCVIPFLPGDIFKIAVAFCVGPKLRQAVRRLEGISPNA